MGLTRDQLIELAAAFGPSVLQGIGQGGQASADRALTEQDRARQAEQELYRRRQDGRADLTGFYQNQLNRDINAAWDFAAQSPLGAEQLLARNMARMRQVGQAAGQYRPPTGMSPAASAFAAQQPNFLAPFASADFQQTVSPEATARSIAERRKALAAINPSFQFGSMSDFGLPSLDTEVAQYQTGVRDRRQTSENEQLRLLTEQMREASASQIPGATGATTPGTGTTAPKKPSLLRRIAGAALTAAPIVAAPFTGGTSLALIGAGAGAAKGLLEGGGMQGALTGGLTGAATSALLGGASRGAGEATGAAVKRAILNPRALAQIAGGAAGGQTGAALQMLSAALPGASAAPTRGQGQSFLDTASPVFGQAAPARTPGVTFGDSPMAGGAPTGAFRPDIKTFSPAAAFAPSAVGRTRIAPGRASTQAAAPLPSETAAMFRSRAQLPYPEAMPETTYRPRPDALLSMFRGQYSPEQLAALQAALQRLSPAGKFDFNAMMDRPLGPKTLDERFSRYSLTGRGR